MKVLPLALAVPFLSFAAPADCPQQVRNALQFAGIPNAAEEDGTNDREEAIKIYRDAQKKVQVEASTEGKTKSWVKITFGSQGETTYRSYSIASTSCRAWVVISDIAVIEPSGKIRIAQPSGMAQFCRNANAGRTPVAMSPDGRRVGYPEDQSGSVDIAYLEELKAMCKSIAIFL